MPLYIHYILLVPYIIIIDDKNLFGAMYSDRRTSTYAVLVATQISNSVCGSDVHKIKLMSSKTYISGTGESILILCDVINSYM